LRLHRAAPPEGLATPRGCAYQPYACDDIGAGLVHELDHRAEDFESVPWDMMWSVTVFLWADVCSRLGLPDRAVELYQHRPAPDDGCGSYVKRRR
jgi:hypothetical protein